jgi:hypothetical protein
MVSWLGFWVWVVGLLVGEDDTWSLVVSLRLRVGLVKIGKMGWRVWWWWLMVVIVVVVGGDKRGVELQAICVIRLKIKL